MPNPIPIIQGTLLTASVATFFTVGVNDPKVKQVILTSVRFVNTDSVAHTFTMYIVPAGASASDANCRFKTFAIPAAGDPDSSQYFVMSDVILPGTRIQALADVASKVAISANGVSAP